jgi:hypothetical protein
MISVLFALLYLLQQSVAFHHPIAFRSNSRLNQFSLKMSSEENNLILVVGSANQDLTSNTAVLPTIGETVMVSSFHHVCFATYFDCISYSLAARGMTSPLHVEEKGQTKQLQLLSANLLQFR